MSTSQKNAVAEPAKKAETAKPNFQTPQPREAKPTVVEQAAAPKTIEAQKEKARLFTQLFEKRQKLNDTREELEDFTFSNTAQQNKLQLSDGKGVTFNTYNPLVIEKVYTLVLGITAQQLEETERQILAL